MKKTINALFFVAVIVSACTTTTNDKARPPFDYVPKTSYLDEKGRIVDNIDFDFVNDPALHGNWNSVDFVGEIQDFNPTERTFKGDLYLKNITFNPDGSTNGVWKWTKGYIIHTGDKTAARYIVKIIEGHEFLFFEWKSGDYTIRHMKPKYYVLERAH